MRVQEIKYDTDPSLFIKESDATKCFEEQLNTFREVYINGIGDAINQEMTNGGLDEYSFCLKGKVPLREKAVKIKASLSNLEGEIENVKTSIINAAKNHRKEEFSKLVTEINKHLEELNAELATTKIKDQQARAQWSAYYKKINNGEVAVQPLCPKNHQVSITNLEKQIKEYEQKRDSAAAEAGRI